MGAIGEFLLRPSQPSACGAALLRGHADDALRILNSPIAGDAIPAKKPRPRNTGYFAHGELSRRIYAALRTRETVSAAELADMALADKSIEDAGVRATFVARFLVRLDQMAARGHIERVGSGQGVRWRLHSLQQF